MIAVLIFVFVCAAILGGIAGLKTRSDHARHPKIAANWQPPKSDSLPYAKKKYFFSVAERSFYEVLRRLVPKHTVFAKVRLADLIYVTKGTGAWRQHFNRISAKHLDFVLCDANLAPIVAIELDDSSHDEEDRQLRDGFVDEALAAAAVPIVRIPCQRAYTPNEIRERLRPYISTIVPG